MSKNKITGTKLVGSGLGLTPQTATLAHCNQSIGFISEGVLAFTLINDRIALVGDRSEESRMIGYFFQESLKDELFSKVPPVVRIAHIINRLASSLDAHAPCGPPSRMQMLWMFQHSNEIER